jgi:hypothetical protein
MICFATGILSLLGCASTPPKSYDYSAFLAHRPRSILVLPPQNQTTEVMAPYIYLSTITYTLAEKGYYVFPVAVVDTLMKENGVPTPDEMAQIPLKKIQEVIDPDAVLYLTILEWGAKYQLIDTSTIVHIKGRLVDTDTGILLWEGERNVVQDSGSHNGGDIVGMMVTAIVEKITTSIADPTRDLAYQANAKLFNDEYKGLPKGQRHKDFSEDQKQLQKKASP